MASLATKNIKVEVNGSIVTLNGIIESISEKVEPRRAAFFAPRVTKFINNLRVEFYSEFA